MRKTLAALLLLACGGSVEPTANPGGTYVLTEIDYLFQPDSTRVEQFLTTLADSSQVILYLLPDNDQSGKFFAIASLWVNLPLNNEIAQALLVSGEFAGIYFVMVEGVRLIVTREYGVGAWFFEFPVYHFSGNDVFTGRIDLSGGAGGIFRLFVGYRRDENLLFSERARLRLEDG